jgi:hypothetical protein
MSSSSPSDDSQFVGLDFIRELDAREKLEIGGDALTELHHFVMRRLDIVDRELNTFMERMKCAEFSELFDELERCVISGEKSKSSSSSSSSSSEAGEKDDEEKDVWRLWRDFWLKKYAQESVACRLVPTLLSSGDCSGTLLPDCRSANTSPRSRDYIDLELSSPSSSTLASVLINASAQSDGGGVRASTSSPAVFGSGCDVLVRSADAKIPSSWCVDSNQCFVDAFEQIIAKELNDDDDDDDDGSDGDGIVASSVYGRSGSGSDGELLPIMNDGYEEDAGDLSPTKPLFRAGSGDDQVLIADDGGRGLADSVSLFRAGSDMDDDEFVIFNDECGRAGSDGDGGDEFMILDDQHEANKERFAELDGLEHSLLDADLPQNTCRACRKHEVQVFCIVCKKRMCAECFDVLHIADKPTEVLASSSLADSASDSNDDDDDDDDDDEEQACEQPTCKRRYEAARNTLAKHKRLSLQALSDMHRTDLSTFEQQDWQDMNEETMTEYYHCSARERLGRNHVALELRYLSNNYRLRLIQDFLFCAQTYGKIIISEMFLPLEKQTFPPFPIGGHAGGVKYKVRKYVSLSLLPLLCVFY